MGVAKSMTLRGGGGGGGPTLSVTMTLIFPKIVWTCPLRCDNRDPKLDIAANREASNPESLSEAPERLSETKAKNGSPTAAAAKKTSSRSVLHFLHLSS